MKTMKMMIIPILLLGMTLQTKASNPVWETKIKAPQVNINEVRMAKATPSLPPSAPAFDKCRKYKSKQIAGFVLIPVSLGMMAGGGYLIYTGAKNIIDKTEVGMEGVSTDVSKEDKVFLGVGSGLVFAGAVLFPTGLVLGIKGGTNYNRDCRGGGSSLHIRPTGKGISMALKF